MDPNCLLRLSLFVLPGFIVITPGLLLPACGEEPPKAPSNEPSEPEAAPAKPEALEVRKLEGTRVVMLGTGTPVPNPERSGPSVAVVAGHQAYVVDFGPGVVRRAVAAAMKGIPALQEVYLTRAFATHLHSDHTAGYADLILTPAAVGRRAPLQVYGPLGIKEMTDNILAAYGQDLAVRARGRPPEAMPGYAVETHVIEPGEIYKDRNVKVTAFSVDHGDWEHAYGFRFDAPDRSIVVSGDTAPARSVIDACQGCDVLVHEVYCRAGLVRGPSDWRRYHLASHTSTEQLAALAAEAKPKMLVLYHLLFFGCTEEQLLSELKARYKGEVALARDLDVY